MTITQFTHQSDVNASIGDVWNFVSTPKGINTELMPIMRMSIPKNMAGRTIGDMKAGEHIGRSWLLLGGFVPFEFDNITLAEVDPGERFLECSTMGSMSYWQHERKLESKSRTLTQVTDNIEYTMRLPIPGAAKLTKSILRRLFRHRHKQLRKHFAQLGNPSLGNEQA